MKRRHLIPIIAAFLAFASVPAAAAAVALAPAVEAEEDVYTFTPPDNGSGPMWCHGSSCLVRVGDRVFASGIQTLPDAKPLNNIRWTMHERTPEGWTLRLADPVDRTREPSPLATFADGRLFLSVNPTLVADPTTYSGPARPAVLEFPGAHLAAPFRTLTPSWNGAPRFTEHSYRSFAADGPGRELVLFQNVGDTHAEWSFLDREGRWSARGRLTWPMGADYAKPQPIRICYPNVALRNRAVWFFGVSDILEPNPEWRAFKRQLTGKEWDYDFRRLFITWTPDLTREPFRDWVEIASREMTCGGISSGDLWVAPDGAVHLLWYERAIDERLREKFFPDARQSHALHYAVLRDGRVASRRTILEAVEGGAREVPSAGRFHATPDQRLFIVCHVSGADASGRGLSENRVYEVNPDGSVAAPVRIPFKKPFTSYFTATPRAGNPPSMTIDFLGHQAGQSTNISYGCVRLVPAQAGASE